jgi:HK97 family phage prohead protease
MSAPVVYRDFPLDDLKVSGRTVIAYAAVFSPYEAEIRDEEGHYIETIDAGAFERTLAERRGKVQVFYNHGRTIHGQSSERFSMPLGVPEEVRADGRGLLTVTKYHNTTLADEVLEGIRSGAITGQSFSGRFLTSDRRRGTANGLPRIHRTEIMLREYGPTPLPAYSEAAIVGVRTGQDSEELWRTSSAARRREVAAFRFRSFPEVPARRS